MSRKEIVDGIIEDLDELRNLEHTYEMASIQPRESGLKYVIWLDPSGLDRKTHSLPRVKVEVKTGKRTELIPVILYPDGAKLLKGKKLRYQSEVEKWVDDRRDIIIRHYNHEISDYEVLKEIIEFNKLKDSKEE